MGLQKYEHGWVWSCTPLIPALRKQPRLHRETFSENRIQNKNSVNLSIHQYIKVVGGGIGFQDI